MAYGSYVLARRSTFRFLDSLRGEAHKRMIQAAFDLVKFFTNSPVSACISTVVFLGGAWLLFWASQYAEDDKGG